MKFLKSNRMISYLFALSSILLAIAYITISKTFAYPDDLAYLKKWDVKLDNVVETNALNVRLLEERINMDIALEDRSDIKTTVFSIANAGEYDAVLSGIDMTDLKNITYGDKFLSDYVQVYIRYADDTKENSVLKDNDVATGDILSSQTKNKVLISVKYKDDLTDDEIKELNNYLKTNELKFSLSISFNYVEKNK